MPRPESGGDPGRGGKSAEILPAGWRGGAGARRNYLFPGT